MPSLDYATVAERDPEILTPISAENLELLARHCRVRDGSIVLDVGCGKGFLLRQWAKRWKIDGTGLEIRSAAVAYARRAAASENLRGHVHFVEAPASEARVRPGGYDVITCLGASFALGGFASTVNWMRGKLRLNGLLTIGEVYLRESATMDLAQCDGIDPARSKPKSDLLDILYRHGLSLISVIEASTEDWDRYCYSTWQSVHAWGRENPNHPQHEAFLQEARQWCDWYFRFARRALGWSAFIAVPRNPGSFQWRVGQYGTQSEQSSTAVCGHANC